MEFRAKINWVETQTPGVGFQFSFITTSVLIFINYGGNFNAVLYFKVFYAEIMLETLL